MTLNRRQLLSAGLASGALLLSRPVGALAAPLIASTGTAAGRASRLFRGTALAHADLHNHSVLSDGSGDPAGAFASMRSHGLDVAALTDHATTSKLVKPGDEVCNADCHSVLGIDEESWQQLAALADAANEEHAFSAVRGFEWSSPTLGHVNVWFSHTWIDPLHTAGTSTGEGISQWAREIPGLGEALSPVLDPVSAANPTAGTTMRPFYEWLKGDPGTPAIGGGLDAIAGFNHPGREPGRFGYFAYDAALRDRVVSMEVFNRSEDYLFEGLNQNQQSPLNQCLNAGWRVGLLGVTDEHGETWGVDSKGESTAKKGRAGLWVTELTRAGVREAMLARRFFATVEEGLRLDASAASGAGAPVRMGSVLQHSEGPVTFELDIDKGADWVGKTLGVQVLVPGTTMPEVKLAQDVVVPSLDQPVISLTVDLDVADARWVVLRVTDPERAADGRIGGTPAASFADFGGAVAYASPFFLEPAP